MVENEAARPLRSRDAIKTYRYLRIGMLGAVLLLTVSTAIERAKVDCWQTSISAYYYTPVRAIFVGTLLAVGFALIVIKGRGWWEDSCLNAAGMLAPLVAVAPTTDFGTCWSVRPRPLPVRNDGSLAKWVVTNIDNNINALLIAGAIGLVVAFVIVIFVYRSVRAPVTEVDKGTWRTLLAAAVLLAIVWLAYHNWNDFDTRAHGFAAVALFVFLILAVVGKAFEYRSDPTERYFLLYAAIALAMIVSGLAIPIFRIGGDHTVLVLESTEIVLFAAFWLVQTAENWSEEVTDTPPNAPA
jgi:hypothetical protein